MVRGLGKGLDSLIPNYYDEDFDSNGAQSLEDMLNDDVSIEESDDNTDESKSENVDESVIDEVDIDDKVDNQEESEKEVDEDTDESVEDSESSEDVSSDENNEDSVSSPQDIKKQENVAEVLDIVDKNPRITLWSSRSAAVFRYLRKTEPEFSISKEASILIDEAVSKKYPHIWELFEGL